MESKGLSSSSLHYRILTLGRSRKKLIMVLADFMALPFALWSGYALRLAEWWPEKQLESAWWLFVITPVFGLFVFAKLGLYRAVVRFMGTQAIWAVVKGVALLALMMWSTAFFFQVEPFPRSVPINFALAALVYVGGSRLLVRNYYHWLLKNRVQKHPVLIYGAGGSGVQLALALAGGKEYIPVGFLDDERTLWGSVVSGLPVYNPIDLPRVITETEATHVLLALPSVDHRKRKLILESLSEYPIHVKTIPSMPEIVSGDAALENLREVEPEDLLGRDPVPPIQSLIDDSLGGKVVLVSGAGGSIGSEICRQIVNANPKALIMLEISEYALYAIEQELSARLKDDARKLAVIPMLGSVLDEARVNAIIKHFGVQTVYHAAAYKHVPMVEHNLFEGIRNNTLGTKVIAQAAHDNNVERFVLISTDKAVRPTNVMGASKRFAEIVLQDMAARGSNTVFSMVRFGNVLGSSGSVVPLFRKQIDAGGPVTVTHPEITRFFMTIPEAASLVIQAGSMAKGGDVFVLDMGESVRIVDLARKMISLIGYEVRSEDNPTGDIAIEFTGLRPGEKLYEELLIGEEVIGTEHPKIMRAEEEIVSHADLMGFLEDLEEAYVEGDCKQARDVLQDAINGFAPSSPVVDWLEPKLGKNGLMH